MDIVREDIFWNPGNVASELAALKLHLIREGRRLFDLSMINPDLEPPRELRDRLSENLNKFGGHRYAVSRGVRPLREGFAKLYARFGVELDPEISICASAGSKEGMLSVLRCLKRESDEDVILLGTPTYPAHLSAVRLAGFVPKFFDISGGFSDSTLEEISELLSQYSVRACILNSPNNPTGMVAPKSFLKGLRSKCVESSCLLVNDFVYGELCFSAELPTSVLATADAGELEGVVEITSLSKSCSIPGWRMGAVLGDPSVVRAVAHYKSLADYGTFLPLQLAASRLLNSDVDAVAETRAEYKSRAEFFCSELEQLGWEYLTPQAGCCVWAKIPSTSVFQNSEVFCKELLTQKAVLPSPGILYGQKFASWVRFALIEPIDHLEEVVSRLKEFCEETSK